VTGVQDEVTVYYLDRPGAWGRFGLGALLVLVPLTLAVAFSIPGVFFEVFPNAPRRRDPLGMAFLVTVAAGMVGLGVFFLSTAIRTLRDRAPKLEFTPAGIIDHRGRNTVEWERVVSASFAMEKTGDRVKRAVVTLAVIGDTGVRGVDIDLRGLSKSPKGWPNRHSTPTTRSFRKGARASRKASGVAAMLTSLTTLPWASRTPRCSLLACRSMPA
jgi:hypothetical protein